MTFFDFSQRLRRSTASAVCIRDNRFLTTADYLYTTFMTLWAKEETVLQGMIDKWIEIGRCYGMDMNVEKNKSNENFMTIIPGNNYDRPKATGECEIF